MLMLSSGKSDPFVGIVGALSELQAGELGLFQVLWQPVNENWHEIIVNAVTDLSGEERWEESILRFGHWRGMANRFLSISQN